LQRSDQHVLPDVSGQNGDQQTSKLLSLQAMQCFWYVRMTSAVSDVMFCSKILQYLCASAGGAFVHKDPTLLPRLPADSCEEQLQHSFAEQPFPHSFVNSPCHTHS